MDPRLKHSRLIPAKSVKLQRTSGGTDSILSKAFTDILSIVANMGEDINDAFNRKMELFLSDIRNSIPQNTKDRSSARGNLRKELCKPNMSWKVFCKGLRFLGVCKFDLTFRLHDENNKVIEYTLGVNMGKPIYPAKPYVVENYALSVPVDWTKINDGNKDGSE